MRVVVTGTSGFVGSHLAHRLVERGDDVIGIDRRPAAGASWQHVRADLVDATTDLEHWCRLADAVVHLAARSGVRSAEVGIAELRERDIVTATDRVLAAVPADVQLVVASSSSVYGGARAVAGGLRPSHESDPLRPRGDYARAKARMESRVAERTAEGGRVTVVRPFTVAGEGQRADMALSIWLEQARLGHPLTVLGGLDRRRDITDVHKVVDALMVLVDRGLGGTYNLGSGRPCTLGQMVDAVSAAVGWQAAVVVTPARRDEVPATFADTTRSDATFGFGLGADLDDLVERQLRWATDSARGAVGTALIA